MKKHLTILLVVILSFLTIIPIGIKAAELEKAQCTMTIDAAKNTQANPASASGACNDQVFGYYAPDSKTYCLLQNKSTEVCEEFVQNLTA